MDASSKIRTNVYLDKSMKDKAKELFKNYGLSLSDALNIFLAQSVFSKGLPFAMNLPEGVEFVSCDEDDFKDIERVKKDDAGMIPFDDVLKEFEIED